MNEQTADQQNSFTVTGVAKDSGAMETQNIPIASPLPCLVILVHGVNDIGDLYPNLDKHLCNGLNKRLGRTDLSPHKWRKQNERDEKGNVISKVILEEMRNSPVIPFYWGYRPVDKEVYQKDQERYLHAVQQGNGPMEVPYDAYVDPQTPPPRRDNLGNLLHENDAIQGGPYTNATTTIPDMYGPGPSGLSEWLAATFTPEQADMPHRIYLVYAAQRLADLIIRIRSNSKTEYDVINIVAHSQGTIISMLANFIVASQFHQNGFSLNPADSVILCHSSYSLSWNVSEMLTKPKLKGMQADEGRQKTFVDFVKLMADPYHDRLQPTVQELFDLGCIGRKNFSIAEQCLRDNYGRVFNYFCPNDQIVSLRSVQGIGWQGVPDSILNQVNHNFKQRVFADGFRVGEPPKNRRQIQTTITTTIDRPDYIPELLEFIETSNGEKDEYRNGHPLSEKYLALLNQKLEFYQGLVLSAYYLQQKNKIQIVRYLTKEEVESLPVGENYHADFRMYNWDPSLGYTSIGKWVIPKEHYMGNTTNNKLLNMNFARRIRTINAEPLPEPFEFKIDHKEPQAYDLGWIIEQSKINSYYTIKERMIKPSYIKLLENEIIEGRFYELPQSDIARMNHLLWDGVPQIISANFDQIEKQLVVTRCLTQKEWDAVQSRSQATSHHSAILLSADAVEKAMAMDLAVGKVRAGTIDNKKFFKELIHLADWKHPNNPDKGVVHYYQTGILPEMLKQSMYYPQQHMPFTITNIYFSIDAMRRKYGGAQWLLPDVDNETEG